MMQMLKQSCSRKADYRYLTNANADAECKEILAEDIWTRKNYLVKKSMDIWR